MRGFRGIGRFRAVLFVLAVSVSVVFVVLPGRAQAPDPSPLDLIMGLGLPAIDRGVVMDPFRAPGGPDALVRRALQTASTSHDLVGEGGAPLCARPRDREVPRRRPGRVASVRAVRHLTNRLDLSAAGLCELRRRPDRSERGPGGRRPGIRAATRRGVRPTRTSGSLAVRAQRSAVQEIPVEPAADRDGARVGHPAGGWVVDHRGRHRHRRGVLERDPDRQPAGVLDERRAIPCPGTGHPSRCSGSAARSGFAVRRAARFSDRLEQSARLRRSRHTRERDDRSADE